MYLYFFKFFLILIISYYSFYNFVYFDEENILAFCFLSLFFFLYYYLNSQINKFIYNKLFLIKKSLLYIIKMKKKLLLSFIKQQDLLINFFNNFFFILINLNLIFENYNKRILLIIKNVINFLLNKNINNLIILHYEILYFNFYLPIYLRLQVRFLVKEFQYLFPFPTLKYNKSSDVIYYEN
jgi:hypothetical protein